jgi:Asp-tRNA(Asn)/Glu-tRNA(Gln) amidotransferase A subunit family amidase
LKSLHLLSALEAARAIETREITAERLALACIERIAQRNPDVRAFVAHDPNLALADARQADAEPAGPPLRGIPFAAKDIFDTVDYPTTYGSPIYEGHRPAADAACIADAKAAGAVLIGKVATSEFATRTPGATRNPLRLSHTPGGSSSGSAAAVADGMVPIALGSQTTGSIVRPAIYCGVVGYKPTFQAIPAAGMKPLSPSQDTVGVLARSVTDATFFVHGPRGVQKVLEPLHRPRIGICQSLQWAHASADALQAIEQFAQRLERAGAVVHTIALPAGFEAALSMQAPLTSYEARHSLAHEYRLHRSRLSTVLRERLAAAESTGLADYLDMTVQAAKARLAAAALFEDLDALLYPATDGEAEFGLEHSGSPRFGALWTMLHLPSVALPIAHGRTGLPLGAQFIGAHAEDLRCLAVAHFASALSEPLLTSRLH